MHGLKHKHKIYEYDFESKGEFLEYFKLKKNKLKEIKSEILKIRSEYENDFDGHVLERNVMDEYEDILRTIDNAIDEINDQIYNLKE